jgi:hypothetical protein
MQRIHSQIDPQSPTFRANHAHHAALEAELPAVPGRCQTPLLPLLAFEAWVKRGGGPADAEQQNDSGDDDA